MHDYFSLHIHPDQLRSMSVLALAHIGDGVYELLCRGWLCTRDLETIKNLHRATVSMVCAPAQAEAVKKLLPVLTQEEYGVYRRGRNANVHQIPRNASRGQYAQATALEALFGWLYLQGQTARINELFAIILDETEGGAGNAT